MLKKLTISLNDLQYDAFRTILGTNRISLATNLSDLTEALKTTLTEPERENITVYMSGIALQQAVVEELIRIMDEHPSKKESIITI